MENEKKFLYADLEMWFFFIFVYPNTTGKTKRKEIKNKNKGFSIIFFDSICYLKSCIAYSFVSTVTPYPDVIFPCCLNMQIDSIGFVHALVFSSLLYNENNH